MSYNTILKQELGLLFAYQEPDQYLLVKQEQVA